MAMRKKRASFRRLRTACEVHEKSLKEGHRQNARCPFSQRISKNRRRAAAAGFLLGMPAGDQLFESFIREGPNSRKRLVVERREEKG